MFCQVTTKRQMFCQVTTKNTLRNVTHQLNHQTINATGKEDEESEEFKKTVKKRPTAEEIKLKKKLKQKERMAKIRLKRQENPDSESEKTSKRKIKIKT